MVPLFSKSARHFYAIVIAQSTSANPVSVQLSYVDTLGIQELSIYELLLLDYVSHPTC
jgi:hypothetical protein